MPPWTLSAANKKQQEIAKTFHIKLIHNQTSDVDWKFIMSGKIRYFDKNSFYDT